ncbi:MAG: IclR family transcriptional regulator [Dehalococcoidia bacterium]|nr:IclR family transcriptional regulator [Dehalococcoidia bacterium]
MTRALSRSLPVLELLASSPRPLEMADIIARCEMPRATAHRLMTSLCRDGYVVREPDGRFRVSLRIWGVAAAMMARLGVREVAFPYMVDLASALQQQVALAFLENGDACFTERLEVIGGRVNSSLLDIRVPAMAVASGRMLAAHLPPEESAPLLHGLPRRTAHTRVDPAELRAELDRIRTQGFATIDREYDPQGSGVAVPVFDARGQAVAALSIVVWGALTADVLQRALGPALAATRRTSAELGFRAATPTPVA